MAIKWSKDWVKKGDFLFNSIFKRNKQFLYFDEDYYSDLKILA